VVSDVILDPKLEETLEWKEDYPHPLPLFRIDRRQKGRRNLEKIHPKSRGDFPLVGIFATRRQYRPNPTGLTLVELAGRKKNIPRACGLDAVNGSP
jgi:tRNA (adenine37-N6)-methyltransferase